MPRLPDPLALAARLHLSPVWWAKRLASARWAAGVCQLPTPHDRDRWHRASGQPFALAAVAASDVVSSRGQQTPRPAGQCRHRIAATGASGGRLAQTLAFGNASRGDCPDATGLLLG